MLVISRPSATTLSIFILHSSSSLPHDAIKDRIHLSHNVRLHSQSTGLQCQASKTLHQIRRKSYEMFCGLGLSVDAFDMKNDGDGADLLKIEEGIFEPVKISEQEVVDDKKAAKGNLIPPEWKFIQEDLNKSKKERRKENKSQHLEFAKSREVSERSIVRGNGDRVASKRLTRRQISSLRYRQDFDSEKRALQNYSNHWRDGHVVIPDDSEPEASDSEHNSGDRAETRSSGSPQRATPRNPRLQLGNDTMEDLAKRMDDYGKQPKEQDSEFVDNVLQEAETVHKLLSAEEKTLLKAKVPDLKKLTGKKWLPLHTLSASGRTVIVDELLTHGVDVNATDKDGLTALHKAIASGKETIVKHLIKAGADVFVKDKDGASLLHYAVQYGNAAIAKVLLTHSVDVNHSDNDGWTPLHVAVPGGRTELIKLLLKYGADKNLVNQDGNRALDIALAFGKGFCSYHVVKVLKTFPKEKSFSGCSPFQETDEAYLISTV
ncbi:hypothetical protein O6H91_03G111800 [Diphasiastrum complanatum]|uniref:Uncharacterized protein n=1 Tax=Diphasiastrum complanatum TaxID=34168 RepID=A0ACC2EB07_DIPCM|nr:hypothetical protein O6H91_03G111800 [Diphasiastrum complanatum]